MVGRKNGGKKEWWKNGGRKNGRRKNGEVGMGEGMRDETFTTNTNLACIGPIINYNN
jgi:hypothetical protein